MTKDVRGFLVTLPYGQWYILRDGHEVKACSPMLMETKLKIQNGTFLFSQNGLLETTLAPLGLSLCNTTTAISFKTPIPLAPKRLTP